MKSLFCFTLAALVIASLCPPLASAADNTPASGKLTQNEMIFQSSKLSDLNVYNQSDPNKKLGNLENLVINAHTGQVLCGVLDTGLGGKIIPVPWNALQLQKTTKDNSNPYWLTLNKTSDELANAPTFDKDHWPDFTNSQWKQSIDNFFGVRMAAKPEHATGPGELTTNEMIFRSSKLSDLDVYNRNDTSKKLGNFDNLIINAHSGRVLYGIVDTGLGGKNIAVPWNAFQLQKKANENKYWLTLSKTQGELANAPTFDKDRMSEVTDSNWQQTVDKFFGVRTAARPEENR